MAGPGIVVHATAIGLAVDPDGPLCGVCFVGDPGTGKSLTALEAIAACPYGRTSLVADDAVVLHQTDTGITAAAPATASHGAGPAIDYRGNALLHVNAMPGGAALPVRFAVERTHLTASMPNVPTPRTWPPFQERGPTLPLLHVHNGGTLRLLIRSLLTGHSLLGGFDSVPAGKKYP